MSRPETRSFSWHEDPQFFEAAVSFTAKETTFSPRLVEKDYFCTVLLEYLAMVGDTFVFKGGTCLAKIHAAFYRLSEDLDFVISMPVDSSRSERSKMATGLKDIVNALHRQSESQLRPVLRARDYVEFDLERAFRIVKDVAAIIG